MDEQAIKKLIDTLLSVNKAVTDVVQIYGDDLIIGQVTAVGGWPEQVAELLASAELHQPDGDSEGEV